MVAVCGVRSRKAAAVLGVTALLAVSASGCSALNTINKVGHAVNANRSVIQTFTQGLKAGQATPFEATYETPAATRPSSPTPSSRPRTWRSRRQPPVIRAAPAT